MKVYKLFSNKIPNCQFPNGIINEIIVLANSEAEAKEIIKKDYYDSFVCNFNEIEIVVVCDNVNNPQIITMNYTNGID
jgi:hypothetical protein